MYQCECVMRSNSVKLSPSFVRKIDVLISSNSESPSEKCVESKMT